MLDDLPMCFKRPKDTNKVDLYFETVFQTHADELHASTRLREALLTGSATAQEFKCDALSAYEKKNMGAAMKTDWSKWTEFGAYKKLPPRGLRELLRRNPGIRPAGARWVLTSKGQNVMQARLVVQGCQEDKSQIRTDAPTGSRGALYLALATAAQKN
eukprot:9353701-Pyramimonas_sp.AAC.1